MSSIVVTPKRRAPPQLRRVVDVHVGVDEPRQQRLARAFDDRRPRRVEARPRLAHLGDDAAAHQDVARPQRGLAVEQVHLAKQRRRAARLLGPCATAVADPGAEADLLPHATTSATTATSEAIAAFERFVMRGTIALTGGSAPGWLRP